MADDRNAVRCGADVTHACFLGNCERSSGEEGKKNAIHVERLEASGGNRLQTARQLHTMYAMSFVSFRTFPKVFFSAVVILGASHSDQ